ncbi:hypothetical protein SCLCIDRAFT_811146 [Scleroderma citrinum Foug A]|uniref:Uncharacterized protein n=1 Tax=Scleroderma citrinum Foug A TaxID=1036808 RepID=A0A0C3E8B6_9AGAM|nr:hypothetical protein SCLCIDRAFT_811146 [Scleroderma citrinum Foug A]
MTVRRSEAGFKLCWRFAMGNGAGDKRCFDMGDESGETSEIGHVLLPLPAHSTSCGDIISIRYLPSRNTRRVCPPPSSSTYCVSGRICLRSNRLRCMALSIQLYSPTTAADHPGCATSGADRCCPGHSNCPCTCPSHTENDHLHFIHTFNTGGCC